MVMLVMITVAMAVMILMSNRMALPGAKLQVVHWPGGQKCNRKRHCSSRPVMNIQWILMHCTRDYQHTEVINNYHCQDREGIGHQHGAKRLAKWQARS